MAIYGGPLGPQGPLGPHEQCSRGAPPPQTLPKVGLQPPGGVGISTRGWVRISTWGCVRICTGGLSPVQILTRPRVVILTQSRCTDPDAPPEAGGRLLGGSGGSEPPQPGSSNLVHMATSILLWCLKPVGSSSTFGPREHPTVRVSPNCQGFTRLSGLHPTVRVSYDYQGFI